MFWYHFLDYFFLIFHTVFTLFNIFGWVWEKTRLANFITLSLTAFSWFLLGIFYGIGFCPLTEWHWQVLEKLGNTNLPYSYIRYVILRISGIDTGETLAEVITLIIFFVSFAISVYLNFFRKKHR
ncbi:MAG: DUF2784 domain-containing protein [Bacteroidales bacterium]|jgi:hypothetical protein|nr:DUF2784 domain-containing protein [Bacteroidales bacterium]MDD4214477.1 DUF2784 domain-containing protein [Bacteroidales bacterium]